MPKKAGRKQFDPKGKEWDEIYKNAKAAMGGMEPIHAGPETHDRVHRELPVSRRYEAWPS